LFPLLFVPKKAICFPSSSSPRKTVCFSSSSSPVKTVCCPFSSSPRKTVCCPFSSSPRKTVCCPYSSSPVKQSGSPTLHPHPTLPNNLLPLLFYNRPQHNKAPLFIYRLSLRLTDASPTL